MADTAVDALIGRVYEAPLSPEGWRSLVPALEGALGGGVALFVRRAGAVGLLAGCSNCTPDQMEAYENGLWREDRAMARIAAAPVGEILLDSRIVAQRERLRSVFYNDYLGAIGSDRGLYASCHRSDGEVFVVSAQRPARFGDFTADELRLMERIAPHLQRSYRTWRRLRTAQEQQLAALQALDHMAMGMVLADSSGLVRFVNDAAEGRFREGALRLVRGRVATHDPRATARLRAAIFSAACREGAVADIVEIPAGPGSPGVSLVVAPLSAVSDRHETEPLAVLLLSSGEAAAVEPATVGRAWDLTPAEARLLSALVAGERLADYAERTGVGLTTAKTHLRALFDKTGERRQADLIRVALADPGLRLKRTPPA